MTVAQLIAALDDLPRLADDLPVIICVETDGRIVVRDEVRLEVGEAAVTLTAEW